MTAGRRDQLADHARHLASAGFSYATGQDFDGCVRHIARELGAMIRQAQAEALMETATEMLRASRTDEGDSWARFVRDRAAALRVTTDHPDVTQDAP